MSERMTAAPGTLDPQVRHMESDVAGFRRLDEVAKEALASRDAAYNAAQAEEAHEAFLASPELQELNDTAQIQIWGTEGVTLDPSIKLFPVRNQPASPVEGIVPKILNNPNVSKEEKERQAKAYEDDILKLVNGGNHSDGKAQLKLFDDENPQESKDQLQLCQAKLIMDLRTLDIGSSVRMIARFVAKGMDASEAADKVKEIYAAKDAKRLKIIRDEHIYTAEQYMEKFKRTNHKGKKMEDQPEAQEPPSPAEPATQVQEPAARTSARPQSADEPQADSERFAYDKSGRSAYYEKRKPEIKKLRLGQRVVARAAMLADYAASTNTWSPGLYERYMGADKRKQRPQKSAPEEFTYSQSGRSWHHEKRKPEIKKLKLGQRVVARTAELADYAASTNTWSPGLYDRYVNSRTRKTGKRTLSTAEDADEESETPIKPVKPASTVRTRRPRKPAATPVQASEAPTVVAPKSASQQGSEERASSTEPDQPAGEPATAAQEPPTSQTEEQVRQNLGYPPDKRTKTRPEDEPNE